MRGEYRCASAMIAANGELPPHARRIPADFTWEPATAGTTSACAENTVFLAARAALEWNYLRMRGEYQWHPTQTVFDAELPPHARRIPLEVPGVRLLLGTTSACAENTSRLRCGKHRLRNYLRMRGEYPPTVVAKSTTTELPPHARRIRNDCPNLFSIWGTTSACAENTLNELGLL